MALEFRNVTFGPIKGFSGVVPGGAVVGVVGLSGAGIRELLRVGAGWEWVEEGEVVCAGSRRYLNSLDPLDFSPADAVMVEHTFGRQDELTRGRALVDLEALRRSGGCVLMACNEQELLRALCDEVWWVEEGALKLKGSPAEVLDAYNRDCAVRLRQELAETAGQMAPSMRRGDGRAQLQSIQVLGEDGQATQVLRGGEPAAVRVTVRFEAAVADPVVGILIRTRIGMEVYGTNTELEGLKLGPRQAGDTVSIEFKFRCDLCPREYTLTAASHDPDGVWHDWAEDAVAFSVADSRYTAGVANLRAAVQFSVVE